LSLPDPHQTKRRDMARAPGQIAVASSRMDGPASWTLYGDTGVDLDTLHRLMEMAESISEGRTYGGIGGDAYYGSTTLTLNLMAAPLTDDIDGPLTLRLVETLTQDPRGLRILRDRTYRELARLLGPATPAEFHHSTSATVSGTVVCVTVDFEAELRRAQQV